MKQNILALIEMDVNISRFLHFQRVYLQAQIDRLTTSNSDVIFDLMRIKQSDELHERYFQLVDSGHYLQENEELDNLMDTIFMYLVSLQGNPETRINENENAQIGILKVSYSW